MSGSLTSSITIDAESLLQPGQLIESYAAAWLDGRSLPAILRDAVKYALLGPGKRFRPALVLRSCEAVGGEFTDAYAPAAAIEMIHAFSLVHDDLPAMDDDDLRRGRPTLHRHTNEAMAILAGDAMMSLAVELILDEISNPVTAAQIIRELVAGTNDMINGQVYDTLGGFPEGMTPIERLQSIHRNKTGALIRSSCRMGALCGGANQEELQALTSYAEAIGLLFQVIDDLIDVTQSTEHLGKTAGKDVEQEKLTYPALLGIDETRRTAERLRAEAHAALEPLGEKAQYLHNLCDYLAVRTR